MLPNFLIIGGMKCGTTSLYAYLRSHPQVFMAADKELRFFNEELNWKRGLDWYRGWFAGADGARAIGEASPSYTFHPVRSGVPQRIHRLLPDVRLIYLVRHPIKRIESHYRHRLMTGREGRTPDEAVRTDPKYVAGSRYGYQLQQYLEYFRPEQILTLQLERLFSDPDVTSRRVCDFLDIDEAPGTALSSSNVTAEQVVMPALLRPFARLPMTKGRMKWVARRLRHSPLGHLVKQADEPPFTLSPSLCRELAETFGKDRMVLSEIAGQTFDWDLADGRWTSRPGSPV